MHCDVTAASSNHSDKYDTNRVGNRNITTLRYSNTTGLMFGHLYVQELSLVEKSQQELGHTGNR
jgi:hypothetical protein